MFAAFVFTDAIDPPVRFTFAIEPATVPMSSEPERSVETVFMFVVFPATVVTLPEIPDTVVTFARIVLTFVIASVATVPSWISASVLMSAEIAAIESTSAISGPGSGSPVVALKPRTVPLRASFSGNSRSV